MGRACCSIAIFIGCGGGAEAPLPMLEARSWSLPVEGNGLPSPRGMTVGPGDELYVLDTVGRVLVYDAEGNLQRQWRMPDARVGRPEGVCVLRDGRIAVADTHYQRVVFFDAEGNVVGTFGSYGREPGQFIYPVDVVQDPAGQLYVTEYGGNDRVQKFTPEGKFVLQFGGPGSGPGEFDRPTGLAWHEGMVYVADATNNRVHVFTDAGEFVRMFDSPGGAAPLQYPYALALDSQGTLWIVEFGGCCATKMSREGKILGRYGSCGHGAAEFANPWGIAVNSKGSVFVADTGNRRIVELQARD